MSFLEVTAAVVFGAAIFVALCWLVAHVIDALLVLLAVIHLAGSALMDRITGMDGRDEERRRKEREEQWSPFHWHDE